MEEYEQDFDVVSKMEGLKRNMEMAKLKAEVEAWKSEILTQFTSQLAPVTAMAEENVRASHFETIKTGYQLEDGTIVSGHADYEKYRDDGSLKAWIESKPAYLQPALNQAYSQGSAVDVIDLFTDFKRDNNITSIQNQQTNSSSNVVSINRKKAALTSVTTRRGAVNISSAPSDDYDSAFDEALNK